MIPAWAVLPFVAYLLAIALLPFAVPAFWHSNRNKLGVALGVSLPLAIYLLAAFPQGGAWLAHAGQEYAAFISLTASLFVIAGGIRLKGTPVGSPGTNAMILGAGALLASFIGTTGASMLLIRPLLRANEARARKAHVVIFFLFIVSNAGGLLTPLGDPPLYLGFLRGVPFLWTFNLVLPWLLVNSILLTLFFVLDRRLAGPPQPSPARESMSVEGGHNFVWLGGVLAVIYASGAWGSRLPGIVWIQVAAFVGLASGSWVTTRREVRAANRFTWSPAFEVAALFIGIFVTMIPALKLVEMEGARLGLREPAHFFWATGILSSFLDNAPTYLTLSTVAAGMKGVDPEHLERLIGAGGAPLLAAISCGAVFFGAMTYIGNGPNFMVKAIAEDHGIRMPGFFGYLMWSGAVLIPIFILVTVIFF